ncbi:hypothetical protein [Bacillus sp. OAE603]|uniref:hypothetical protein n=1 Tax=Gottfriedia sp. OAE603 TaxID=2663872 RepID=UPI00178A2466
MKESLLQEIHEFSLWGEHADHFEYLASGKDGNVYTRDDLVIKVFKEDGKSRDDGMKLHRLENSIYYPQVEAYTNDFMVSERIYGDTFYHLVGHDDELRIRYENEIQEAMLDAHLVGLDAFDLHNHNIMLTSNGEIRIVDVGRFGTETTTLQFGIFRKLFGSSSDRHHRKHRRHRHHSSSSNHHHRHHHRHSHSHSYSRRSYSSS